MMVKLDILRTGGSMTFEQRRRIYGRIREHVLPRLLANEPVEIEFAAAQERMLWGHQATRILRYKIDPPRT